MQNPTGAPRDDLTRAQIEHILQGGPRIQPDFGAELLDMDLALVEDISDDLEGGTVSWSLHEAVHRACTLKLTRTIEWGNQLVRPYMLLSDGQIEARWNVGVYFLSTPQTPIGETPQTLTAQGHDRLSLLQREIGDDYAATAGATYRTALLDAFSDAGLTGVLIDGSAADSTLPRDKEWPLVARDQADPDQTTTPVTWLRVINDLLRAINFRAVWADQDGIYRCHAYQPPANRGTEWTFDANDPRVSIVGEERTLTEDIWGMPNRWVFRQTNRPDAAPTATEGDGIYTVDESDTTDGDWLDRKLVWTSVIDYEAASQTALESLGDRKVAADKAVTSRLSLTTGPFPGAGHADIYRLTDAEVSATKWQAIEHRMDLAGGDVEWLWEAVQ